MPWINLIKQRRDENVLEYTYKLKFFKGLMLVANYKSELRPKNYYKQRYFIETKIYVILLFSFYIMEKWECMKPFDGFGKKLIIQN